MAQCLGRATSACPAIHPACTRERGRVKVPRDRRPSHARGSHRFPPRRDRSRDLRPLSEDPSIHGGRHPRDLVARDRGAKRPSRGEKALDRPTVRGPRRARHRRGGRGGRSTPRQAGPGALQRPRETRRRAIRVGESAGARNASRSPRRGSEDRLEQGVRVAASSIEDRIREELQKRLTGARDLAFDSFVQTAGGWSHETYVFEARWTEDGRPAQRGYCLRKDPGAGLLRELSSLEEQFRVLKALESTSVPAPKAYW